MSDLEAVAQKIARLAVRDVRGLGRVGPGPVVSVVRDTSTGKIYVGLNTGAPAHVAEVLQRSIQGQQSRIANGQLIVVRTEAMAPEGGHAEACALNAAILDREKATKTKMTETGLRVFELHNVWLKGERAHSAAARCEHCARITRGVSVTQSMFLAEGGRIGTITVPQRGVLKRAGKATFDPVTTVSGEINFDKATKAQQRGMVQRTGGTTVESSNTVSGEISSRRAATPNNVSLRDAGSGLFTAAVLLAEPILRRWFSEHMQEKWKEEEKAMVMKAINANLRNFDMVLSEYEPSIWMAQQAGHKVSLGVWVDTQWVDTDMGPAQTDAKVSYYTVLFQEEHLIDMWPLRPPPERGWWQDLLSMPRITYRRQALHFVIYPGA